MTTVRKYRRTDARQVAALISKTFAQFNSREGTRAGVRRYIEYFTPHGRPLAELHRLFSRTPFRLVAVQGTRVVGVLRARENHLVNLFVDEDYHRQGIASRLFLRFENACRKHGFGYVTVKSSLFAVPFYQSVGYKKTTGVRNLHGLKVQPMRKTLNQTSLRTSATQTRPRSLTH